MVIQSIIDKGRAMAATHREHKTKREIKTQSKLVADYIIERQLDGQDDQIRFNIGHPPDNISEEEYGRRVGALAVSIVKDTLISGNIIFYDQKASEQYAEMAAATAVSDPPAPGTEGVRVIFGKIMDPVPDIDTSGFGSQDPGTNC